MKNLYLAQINRQLFAVDRKDVVGIGICKNESFRPIRKDGGLYLSLPNGKRAIICDVQTLMTERYAQDPSSQHYLIVNHNDLTLGLIMSGKGRIITADVATARPLPPAFTGPSRALVSGVLESGMDLIFLLDLQALLERYLEDSDIGRESRK